MVWGLSWSEVFLCSSGHHPHTHYKQDMGHCTSCDYPFLCSMPRCGVIIKRQSDMYTFKEAPGILLNFSWYCIRYSSIADSISLWGRDRSIGVACLLIPCLASLRNWLITLLIVLKFFYFGTEYPSASSQYSSFPLITR